MGKILRDISIEKQISKHVQHWETERAEWERETTPSPHQAPKKPGSYIAISRELGSGGTEISQRVAEKLGWQHYDREIIEAIASRTRVREELVARFDEHLQSEWETYLYNFLTHQLLNNTQYMTLLTKVLVSIAQCGNAVILGRGANFILPPDKGLRVRVVAPLEVRRDRLMQAKGYDDKAAEQAIAEQDRARHDFLQHHFRCRLEEPFKYDVVINTGQIGLAAAGDFIIHLAAVKLEIPPAHNPLLTPVSARLS
jgi:cytidylate kinase